MGEEINLKDSLKDKKIILATLIIVAVVIISSWYFFIREEDLSGRVEFSISFDKANYSLNESINVTFTIVNNENKTIEISECNTASIDMVYWNSTINRSDLFITSVSWPPNGIKLESGETYEYEINIEPFIRNYLKNSTFHLQGIYRNYNPYEGDFDIHDCDRYYSNEVEITIVSP